MSRAAPKLSRGRWDHLLAARLAKMHRVHAARERARQKYRAVQTELRRTRWQVRDSWYHLTNIRC